MDESIQTEKLLDQRERYTYGYYRQYGGMVTITNISLTLKDRKDLR